MPPKKDVEGTPSNNVLPDAARLNPRSPLRMFVAGCMVVAGFAYFMGLYAMDLTPADVTQRDFIQYWAAGLQLVHHADPYDVAAVYRIERQQGMSSDSPRVSVSPPVALEFALPLAWMKPKTGLLAWLLAELVCTLVSIWLLWRLCGRPDSRIHLLGLAFAPVIASQMSGQLGAFFLLGLVLFLELLCMRPFLAGAALLPFALKPHLILPFVIGLLIWSVSRKNLAPLWGGLSALAASCAASLAVDPRAWGQYLRLTSSAAMTDWPVPTVAMTLRFWIDPSARWIEFLPEALACAWGTWYAWQHRMHWDWMKHGQLAMLVSILCTPYSWISDQCVLLPAVMGALLMGPRKRHSLLLFLLLNGVMLLEIFNLPTMTSRWFVWTAPAWLAWYLYATRIGQARPVRATAAV